VCVFKKENKKDQEVRAAKLPVTEKQANEKNDVSFVWDFWTASLKWMNL